MKIIITILGELDNGMQATTYHPTIVSTLHDRLSQKLGYYLNELTEFEMHIDKCRKAIRENSARMEVLYYDDIVAYDELAEDNDYLMELLTSDMDYIGFQLYNDIYKNVYLPAQQEGLEEVANDAQYVLELCKRY